MFQFLLTFPEQTEEKISKKVLYIVLRCNVKVEVKEFLIYDQLDQVWFWQDQVVSGTQIGQNCVTPSTKLPELTSAFLVSLAHSI